MKISIYILKWIFLIACISTAVPSVSAEQSNQENLKRKIDALISREKIDLGSNKKTPNKHKGRFSLKDIEAITGVKMKEESHVTDDGIPLISYEYTTPPEKEDAYICFIYLDNQRDARYWALHALLLIEDLRTDEGRNIRISNPLIGDFSIMPKKLRRDPHGFDTSESDKVLCIFTRGNTMAIVDSKRNLIPGIPVIEVARKIDALLVKAETSCMGQDSDAPPNAKTPKVKADATTPVQKDEQGEQVSTPNDRQAPPQQNHPHVPHPF